MCTLVCGRQFDSAPPVKRSLSLSSSTSEPDHRNGNPCPVSACLHEAPLWSAGGRRVGVAVQSTQLATDCQAEGAGVA